MTKRRRYRRATAAPRQPPVQAPPPVERAVPWRIVAAALVVLVAGLVLRARSRSTSWWSPGVVSVLPPDSPRLRPDDLIIEPHTVQLPESYVHIRDWSVPRRWILPRYTRERALTLLQDVSNAREALECDTTGCTLLPSIEAVTALTPEARSRLYSVLADIPGNPQADDAFHRVAERGPFSANPALSATARQWIDSFTWSQNGTPTYSDLAGVCAHLSGREECDDFVRTMLSRTSHAVNIRVSDPEAINRAMAEFGPERQREVGAALRTAAASGARTVSLATLLPPWARQRLDTFPRLDEDWTNCFWTATRFAEHVDRAERPVPDDAALDAELLGYFERVQGPHRFGDVLVLRDQNQRPIHAASVLVAGYVFTKNGQGHLQAWRIVPTTDVAADFPDTAVVEYWRARPAQTPDAN